MSYSCVYEADVAYWRSWTDVPQLLINQVEVPIGVNIWDLKNLEGVLVREDGRVIACQAHVSACVSSETVSCDANPFEYSSRVFNQVQEGHEISWLSAHDTFRDRPTSLMLRLFLLQPLNTNQGLI